MAGFLKGQLAIDNRQYATWLEHPVGGRRPRQWRPFQWAMGNWQLGWNTLLVDQKQELRRPSLSLNLYLIKILLMALALSQKLKIQAKDSILTLNAPEGYKSALQNLPAGVKISPKTNNYQQIHWFVMNRAQMEKEWPGIYKLLKPGVICWTYYPKGSSGIQTDLTRDMGWDIIMKHDDLQWINLISFDDTWSTFGFRLKAEKDQKKEQKPKERPIFDYIDAEKRIVRLPNDFERALRKSKKANDFFQTLSFTNKKEYVEWIVSAKREETKNERVKESVTRLEKNWKNPRNM